MKKTIKLIYFVVCGIFCFCFCLNDLGDEKKQVIVNNQIKLSAATDAGFADDKFYSCVLKAVNKQEGTVLTAEELEKITSLSCTAQGITDATGIEKMTNLETLLLFDNDLKRLDVSKNTKLIDLQVNQNELQSLDVSKNTNLTKIYVFKNNLTNLDVSNNTKLTSLQVYDNQLASLDVSKNMNLEYLLAHHNQLSSIDVSNNTKLVNLYLNNNKLASLDVSKNINLDILHVHNNNMTTLDVSNNVKLSDLQVSNNNLSNLDVSKNIELNKLHVYNNKLTSLDVSKNNKLTELDAVLNQLTSLNLSNQQKMMDIRIDYDLASKIDFSILVGIDKLYLLKDYIIPVYSTGENVFELKKLNDYLPNDVSFNGEFFNYRVPKYAHEYEGYASDPTYREFEKLDVSTIKTNDKEYRVLTEYSKINDKNVSFLGIYQIRFVTLKSDKYFIDEENSTIDVGGDNDNEIVDHLETSWDEAVIEIKGDKLILSYNGQVLREFALQRVTNPSTGSLAILMVFGLMFVSVVSVIIIKRRSLKNNI